MSRFGQRVKAELFTDCFMEKVLCYLGSHQVPFKIDHLLKYDSYFKTGGLAKIFATPQDKNQLVDFVRFLRAENIPFFLAGLTSNVLLLNELTYGLVISTKGVSGVQVRGNEFEVEAGYPLSELVRVALVEGCVGIEGLEGIPGTVGGAVVMNAGAYGYSISDHLLKVSCIDSFGNLIDLSKEQCSFKYRDSIFKHGGKCIVVSAAFRLPSGDRDVSARKIEMFHIARHSYQEFAYPNLSSLFSVKGDFYREIFRESRIFTAACIGLKILIRNRLAKFLMRKRPHNILLNKLTLNFLGRNNVACYPSVKSMNILINTGLLSGFDIVEYLRPIRDRLKSSTPIENEIVIGPLYGEIDDVMPLLNNLHDAGLLYSNSGVVL